MLLIKYRLAISYVLEKGNSSVLSDIQNDHDLQRKHFYVLLLLFISIYAYL